MKREAFKLFLAVDLLVSVPVALLCILVFSDRYPRLLRHVADNVELGLRRWA